MTIFEYLLYPTFGLRGVILSTLFSVAIPLIFSIYYEERYPMKTGDKIFMVTLAFLFMLFGTLFAQGPIPLPVWALLAYHFVVDFKYMELPDRVNLWIAGFSVFSVFPKWLEVGFWNSGIVTSAIIFVFLLFMAFIGPLGGGDIKMMTALGLYFSLWEIPTLLFYGALIGLLKGLYLILIRRKEKDTPFPFGPSLILGTLIAICI